MCAICIARHHQHHRRHHQHHHRHRFIVLGQLQTPRKNQGAVQQANKNETGNVVQLRVKSLRKKDRLLCQT